MIRKAIFIGLILASSASVAEPRMPLCVADAAQMPERWHAPAELRSSLSAAPWSQSEARDVEHALKTGVDEMIGYFKRKPSAVESLWDDSVEALIQMTYASANEPEFDTKVRSAARDNLTTLIDAHLARTSEDRRCGDFADALPLAIFAHRLYPAGDARTERITKSANAAYHDCGSLRGATNNIMERALTVEPAPLGDFDDAGPDEDYPDLEDLFELSLWSIWLTEAHLYPDLALPADALAFAPNAWQKFRTYRLPGADAFKGGANNTRFVTMTDLATHLAHIPTGVNRFPLYVADAPQLYRFHRENLYPVMQSGDIELLASLLDNLRQYGCTPENDRQVRDGTRHLLKIFHDSGDKWMNYQPPGESLADMTDYERLHYPWTALLGIRPRHPETPEPGTYGGVIRRWLDTPR